MPDIIPSVTGARLVLPVENETDPLPRPVPARQSGRESSTLAADSKARGRPLPLPASRARRLNPALGK